MKTIKDKGKLRSYFLTNEITALRLLIIVIVSIFVSELLVMYFLPTLRIVSQSTTTLVDSTLLVIIMFPVLYFFFFRPMLFQKLELERTEEMLRKEKELLSITLYSIGDGVISTDSTGRIVIINQVAEMLTGWTQEEAKDKPLEEVFHIINEKTRKRCDNLFRKVLETGTIVGLANDTMLIARDGTERIIADSGAPIHDSEGEIIGTIIVFRDITERIRAEERKKGLEARLRRAEKMEAVGNLAGGVAHDLNNILSGIVGFPQLLLMDVPEDSPLREPLETIRSSGDKATAIVQDLLTLARRGVPITEVINLNDIISKYLESPEYKKLISYHLDVEMKTNLEADLLNISGSLAQIDQTVMNLVSNAAEAMPDGGEIIISTENRYVDRPISGYDKVEEGDYAVFKISDSGIGIASEDIEKIFEPFYTKKKLGRSGTGLGMSIVWGTVQDHQGYINIQSTLGEGTTIILYFPVTREELVKGQPNLSVEDYMGNGQSILVVDDVEEQRKLASGMLNRLGYSVTAVPSGEEAVEYLKNNSVDLVVLDMIMDPGIDGLDTYKQILELHPGQKAIISSGFSETERVKEAQNLGARLYVRKPYTLEKIGLSVYEELSM